MAVFECSYKFHFNTCKCRTNASPEENIEELKNDALAFLVVSLLESLILLFVGAICVDCFNHSAISQVTRMRVKYFESLMRQDMGWFDLEKSKSNFAVRLDEYVSIGCAVRKNSILIDVFHEFQGYRKDKNRNRRKG